MSNSKKKITFLTLFPDFVSSIKEYSIIKRAINQDKVQIDIVNIRDYADQSTMVDDTPYGGGAGMVIKVDPVVKAIQAVKDENTVVYALTPRGKTFNQELASTLANDSKNIVLLSGHYEGIDERAFDYVDGHISIGDFVVTGGELPAMTIVDAIVRLIPGVIKEESHQNESFENNLLEHPHYTRPEEFEGKKVPAVLLSGHHANIEQWRQEESLKMTQKHRKDLLKKEGN